MTDIIVQKKGLLRSSGGPFWYYSSICLPKNIAAALASMDCLSVQSSVSSVAMNATAPVISPFVRIGDRKSTRLNSSHTRPSRMPSSA